MDKALAPLRLARTVSLLSLVLLASGFLAAEETRADSLPNIVIILADDLGWADVGYHDKRAATPNIDRLAAQGIELNRFTVAPMCTPTRAALLTGRYPIRFGLARSVIPPHRNYGLDPGEQTIAERLANAGYARRAIFGKWHLGHLQPQWHPLRNGFTHFHGHYNGAIDYFSHFRDGERDWHIDWDPTEEAGYSTDLIAEAAAGWIGRASAEESPYLCYVAFNAPHSPFQAKASDLERFKDLPGNAAAIDEAGEGHGKLDRSTRRLAAAAMIWSLDEGIGNVLKAIDESGEADNTLVWFSSDNGGVGSLPNNNKPLRGSKLDVFEGGVRVPACVRWPNRWPGGRRIDEPMNCIDVLPTVLAAAGQNAAADGADSPALDGIDVGSLLRGETDSLPRRDLYFYHGQSGPDQEKIAITTYEWKLVILGPSLADTKGITDKHEVLLFRFPDDLLEQENLAAEHSDVVDELTGKLVSFRQLQPADSVPPYGERTAGFRPPANWKLSPQ